MAKDKVNKTQLFLKSRKIKIFIIIFILLLVVGSLGYRLKDWFIAATVNNQPITRFSLDRELEKQGGQKVLDNMILETLILQEAKKKGITANPQEIDQKIGEIEKQFTAQGQTLDLYLANLGQTRKEFQKQIEVQLLVEKMLGSDIKIEDKEVVDYFEKNKDLFPKGTTLESKKDEIKQMLTQQKLSQNFQSWAENLKKEAKINYFLKL